MPALLSTTDDRIADVNPPAESFLNTRRRCAAAGLGQGDAIDAPLEEAFARVRARPRPLFINDVDVGTGERAPVQCNIQIAPLVGAGRVLSDVRAARDRRPDGPGHSVKSAAKSAIGMAEMLAHEIKNPLAGITGAAQLLSMNLDGEDRELTDLIVAETRRIV